MYSFRKGAFIVARQMRRTGPTTIVGQVENDNAAASEFDAEREQLKADLRRVPLVVQAPCHKRKRRILMLWTRQMSPFCALREILV
jgi:hypothetical protein